VRRTLIVAGLCIVGLADLGYGQSRATVEIEAGVGYVFGGGVEDPGPSLPSFDAGIVIWPWEQWGVAVRLVEAPGEDLHAPIDSLDRTFLGVGNLHYWTVNARHRRPLPHRVGLEIGFGMLFGGEFAAIQEFHNPPRRSATPHTFFNGFSVEGLVTRALARYFTVKAGATYDFNVETNNFQPVVLGVLRF
jgi:hypothetical protein